MVAYLLVLASDIQRGLEVFGKPQYLVLTEKGHYGLNMEGASAYAASVTRRGKPRGVLPPPGSHVLRGAFVG